MMEGLGVNFLSAPAPVSTNSLQKDEVHAQVCNQMLRLSEPVELNIGFIALQKDYTLFLNFVLVICFSSLLLFFT